MARILEWNITGKTRKVLLVMMLIITCIQMVLAICAMGVSIIVVYKMADFPGLMGGPVLSVWPFIIIGIHSVFVFTISCWGCMAFLRLRAAKTAQESTPFHVPIYTQTATLGGFCCLAFGILSVAFGLTLDKPIRHNLQSMEQHYVSHIGQLDYVRELNNVQQAFKCCGVKIDKNQSTSIEFWLDNYGWKEYLRTSMGRKIEGDIILPWSCCKRDYMKICINIEFEPVQLEDTQTELSDEGDHAFDAFYHEDCAVAVENYILYTFSVPMCVFLCLLGIICLVSAVIGRFLQTATNHLLEQQERDPKTKFDNNDCKTVAYLLGPKPTVPFIIQ